MHGPVRVPEDAKPGEAIMRVELPESSKFKSFATDLVVELKD